MPKSSGEIEAERRIAEWLADPHDLSRRDAEFSYQFGSHTRFLRLNRLHLEAVPESLRRAKALELLDLSDNQIGELPRWLFELRRLRVIEAASNHLRHVPAEIGGLTELRVLRLPNNQLRDLPATLLALPLTHLELSSNVKLGLPESILERPPREVLTYYFESRGALGRPLREVKLLLVGRGKAGKTTLMKRLVGEAPDANESETHSISIRELSLPCPSGVVQTRAWDFGGQEILHATHQFFLTERSLYIVVLEPRTGLAQRDAEYWLKLIETQGAGSPTIVVLNQSHGRPWRINDVLLRRIYPFIVGFVSTDALEGDGIEEIRGIMIATVEKMPDVWASFANRWREIKDAVAGMPNNFLTYQQYTNLCRKHGEDRPEAQADLAVFLHALGLALYFGNDPRLHDTRVLNPSWVTGGVYAVIRSPSVKENDGQLTLRDMPRVLREAEELKVIRATDYPKKTHAFILDLMRAFQLCYASDEEKVKPTRYLVPELLSEYEPQMDEAWERADVRLRYRYEILSPGLLPRFIVRTHALSDGAPHWRHGVVLRHADTLALIREESSRPELHVFVLGGDDDTRQVLVAMVRRELETLHTEMKIQPVEDLELTGDGGRWISVKALRDFDKPELATQRMAVQPEGTAEIHVSRELDKLLPAEARAIDRKPDTAPVDVRLFVCYAHEDERQLKRLDAMLDILELQHGLAPWIDRRLLAGEEWDEKIRQRLEEMDIFLFIASATSIVRRYIRNTELRRAKERHAKGEVEIVTVKLEPCACDEDEYIGKLHRLAPRLKSVAETSPKSVAWEQVRKDLLPVIERVRAKKTRA